MSTTIYAVKKHDTILIHTIAQWPRAAIVTYLLQDMGQSIFCTDTDETVNNLWRAMSDNAELISVTITEQDLKVQYAQEQEEIKKSRPELAVDNAAL